MSFYPSRTATKADIYRVNPIFIVLMALLTLVLQSYLPVHLPSARYLDLPLLVVVYFSLSRRNPVAGLTVGALIGIAQDTLTRGPLGMIGIVKTVIGYVTAFASVQFDVDSRGFRFAISFITYWINYLLLILVSMLILRQPIPFEVGTRLLVALVNSVIGVLLFSLLDRFRRT